jgi:hypothetical protein
MENHYKVLTYAFGNGSFTVKIRVMLLVNQILFLLNMIRLTTIWFIHYICI